MTFRRVGEVNVADLSHQLLSPVEAARPPGDAVDVTAEVIGEVIGEDIVAPFWRLSRVSWKLRWRSPA